MNMYIHRLITQTRNKHNVSDVSQELESMKNITADITHQKWQLKKEKCLCWQ